MSDFTVLLPEGGELEIFESVPTELKNYSLKTAQGIYAKAPFGGALFQHVAGNGFDIWLSHYLMEKKGTMIGRADQSVLELHIPFSDSFASIWDGFGHLELKENQFDMSYAPFVNNKAQFWGGRKYSTFDVHFHRSFLQDYAPQFKELSLFLEKVEKNEPANLLGITQYLSPPMIFHINEMLNFNSHEALGPRFFESHVHLLLIHLLERLQGVHATARKFTPQDLERAEQARFIILSDFRQYHTISQLAKLVGTNVYKLKTAFKFLFKTTIFKYSRRARLDYALQLLKNTDWILEEIAHAVGFEEPSNFSRSFKDHFKFEPGYVRKKK